MHLPPGTAPAQSYDTTNDALAIVLHILGVHWFKTEYGQACGVLNDYTPGKLREIDAARARAGEPPLNLASLSHEEAVRKAFRAAARGNVTYRFERSELQERIVNAFHGHSARIEDSGAEASERHLNVSPEDAAAICCQYVKTRKMFLGDKNTRPLWMEAPPFAVEDGIQTGSRASGKGTERYGSGSYRRTEVKI